MQTLRYTQLLEEAGFTRNEAEATVTILENAMNEEFPTKHDFKILELKLESKINELEYRLIIKMGAMNVASMTILFTLLQIFR